MYVLKKDGTKSPFNFEKIVDMVQGAVHDFENGSELSDSILDDFTLLLKNNITTTEIQKQLINTAKNKINIDNPEMSMIAGRILMSSIISDAEKRRGFEFGELRKLYKWNVNNGLYEDSIDLLEHDKILEYLENHIDKARNYDYGFASTASWKLRYLHDGETPVEVFALIASRLALESNVTIFEKYELAKRYLDVLSKQKISLATPFLLNLRKKNGNLSSCFINFIPDDLEKQYELLKQMALISKNGGGIGNYIGGVRGIGSRIKTVYGIADSVVPFSKNINDTAIYVNQEGKRKGAITVAVPSWHSDILEFMGMATEIGDSRRKAHDLFLQFVPDDRFYKQWESNLLYAIVCPLEVREKLGYDLVEDIDAYDIHFDEICEAIKDGTLRVGRMVRARDVFKAIINASVISGTPYFFNTTNANAVNPLKDIATIKCGNLCMESFSATNEEYSHTCNLVSIVTPNVDIASDEWEYVNKIAVDMLDTIVDVSTPPTIKAKAHNDTFRVIGIGDMGLADTLAYHKKTYKDLHFIEDMFERASLAQLEQSIERAKKFGKFPMYDKSEWAKGKLYSRDLSWYKENSRYYEEWERLYHLQLEFGIRNAQLQAIAPNTSTSVLQGVVASIFPTYSKYHMDSSSLGALPIMPKYIKERFWYYKDYKHHDIIEMNDFVSVVQKWVDSGISYEWILNVDEITINDIERYYIDAFKKGVKSIYYIRWVKNDEEINEKEECVSCAG